MRLCNEDTANEDAMKLGIMYHFPTKTTVGVIGERLHRYTPSELDFQNERSRYGTWVVVSQELNPKDSVHFGWAHAFASVGNPGQHNDTTLTDVSGATFGPNNNAADMLTAAYKHKYSENLTWYTNVAATFNHADAHYDLGAGGQHHHRLPRCRWRVGRHSRQPAMLDRHDDRRHLNRTAVEVLKTAST